jgi:NAD(P)-dependent dehydrogenase (short-subunit alcohol dehydrogenase family)
MFLYNPGRGAPFQEEAMAEMPLQEQVAIVTGASHGIGRAIAQRLAQLGATVVLAARTTSRLEDLKREILDEGGRALAIPTDLRRPEQIEHLIQTTLEQLGKIDILVNNAGIGVFGRPLHETSLEDWETIMQTNLRAVYVAMRAVTPHLIERRSGYIVNISSLASHNPVPNGAAYAASKWALNGLSVSAAEELRAHGIRVSLVCPGSVDTNLVPGQNKNRARMLHGDDIAHVVAMLVTQSPQSFASEVLIRPTMKP